MKDGTKHPLNPDREREKAGAWTLDEAWESCTGQCGADPWCRVCMREKERLHEEELNRRRHADDKEG